VSDKVRPGTDKPVPPYLHVECAIWKAILLNLIRTNCTNQCDLQCLHNKCLTTLLVQAFYGKHRVNLREITTDGILPFFTQKHVLYDIMHQNCSQRKYLNYGRRVHY